jgi:hypothetical protein
MARQAITVGDILDRLSETSKRPRYAFMVLTLLVEQAGPGYKTGPFIREGGAALPLREWLGDRLARMSGRDRRRRCLTEKLVSQMTDLPEDLFERQRFIDQKVAEHVRATGADNASRVMGELEQCGFLKRHYEGIFTNHENRGGKRHLVCLLDGDAVAALKRGSVLI